MNLLFEVALRQRHSALTEEATVTSDGSSGTENLESIL